MAGIVLAPRSQVVSDLALLGLSLIASTETCDCQVCRHLDLKGDVDLVAARTTGRILLVSYRWQPTYDYRTLTVRSRTESGNPSQLDKLLEHRSLADAYVQSYPSWVVFVESWKLEMALRGEARFCMAHPYDTTAAGGQHFVTVCEECCPGLRVVPRPKPDVRIRIVTAAERSTT
jgi:hypothetical protein